MCVCVCQRERDRRETEERLTDLLVSLFSLLFARLEPVTGDTGCDSTDNDIVSCL